MWKTPTITLSALCFVISILLAIDGLEFGSGAAFAGGLVYLGLWFYQIDIG